MPDDQIPDPVQVDLPTPEPPVRDQVPDFSKVDWSKYNDEGESDRGA
jgi:hypothetical protein